MSRSRKFEADKDNCSYKLKHINTSCTMKLNSRFLHKKETEKYLGSKLSYKKLIEGTRGIKGKDKSYCNCSTLVVATALHVHVTSLNACILRVTSSFSIPNVHVHGLPVFCEA